ncbi:MAG: hypothetical protein M1281_02860 [Chloroflexi bacterium]|nr:hypothetical protein [Chloroflexota bacterium]
MPEQVWVTHICVGRGHNLYASSTEKKAKQIVHEYVKEWWDMELPGEEMPNSPEATVERYFEHIEGDEWANVEPTTLDGGYNE